MIITRLIGGLGNQMFQYAYGLYLAERTQQRLYLDVSAFDTYTLHALAIESFAISAERLLESDRRRIPGRFRGTSRIRELIESTSGRTLKLRREKPFGFSREYAEARPNMYLDGYWQGERFFPQMRDRLRQEFRPANALSAETSRISAKIRSCNSISLHVRRGDYVTDAGTKRIYRGLHVDYYRLCLRDVQQHTTNVKVFLFSNDVQWCLDNLDVGVEFIPVTHNHASTAHEDLHLMSQCRHAVIANSSFSWWGAFLADSAANRRVYYPDPWFNPGTMNGSSIGCDDWISEESIRAGVERQLGKRSA